VNEIQSRKKEKISKDFAAFNFMIQKTDETENIQKEEQILKQTLYDFFHELKKYMKDNNLNEDKFLKNLCDDIYISYRTMGSQYGEMYTTSRQTSQGNQRCYTVSQTPDEFHISSPLGHKPSLTLLQPPRVWTNTNDMFSNQYRLDDFVDETFLQHHTSDFDEMPYLTPTATRLMRDISCSPSFLEENDDTEVPNLIMNSKKC
jgi:hypothetical protein